VAAVQSYIEQIRQGHFPAAEHSFSMDESILKQL
jgi:ketopantoate hydroxymethyltransferase